MLESRKGGGEAMNDFIDEGRILAARRARLLRDNDSVELLCIHPHTMRLEELKQIGIDPADLIANPNNYRATAWGWEGDIEAMEKIK